MEPRNTTSIELYIDSLGPIRNSKIVLKPFLVFSGESGTGKSYTALLVHYLYKVICYDGILEFFNHLKVSYDELLKQEPSQEAETKEKLLYQFTLSQFEEWCNVSALNYLKEMLGNYSLEGKISIKFQGVPSSYTFRYKRETVEMDGEKIYSDVITLNETSSLRLPFRSSEWGKLPFTALFGTYLKTSLHIPQESTFILPPSRGGLVSLSDTGRNAFMTAPGGMYKEFISDFSDLKAAQPKNVDAEKHYSQLSQSLIKGKINIKDNDLYYEQAFGEIPITAGAASVKELAPFVLMLQKGLIGDYSVMFEEPETNLHPELQIRVADTLVYLLQQGCRFQITTHSDYFLRRINDLIRLDILKNKLTTEAYQELCHAHHYLPELTLDKRLIGAYYFKRTSETEVHIIHQEAGNGIPFDTFQSVLHNQLKDSSYIYDKMCESDETVD